MHRRKYKKPDMEIEVFDMQDMIVTSGELRVMMHGGVETEVHLIQGPDNQVQNADTDWVDLPTEDTSAPEIDNQ